MKTDAKTMAEIYRHMADNIDAGIDQLEGISYLQLKSQKWVKKETSVFDFENTQYCILPKTIAVNGVEIPKPLSIDVIGLNNGCDFYMPTCLESGWQSLSFSYYRHYKPLFVYFTKEEAVEASKKLFGIK